MKLMERSGTPVKGYEMPMKRDATPTKCSEAS